MIEVVPDGNAGGEGPIVLEGNNYQGDFDYRTAGTRIHIWNIADDSRLHAANLLINGLDPATACINNSYHGPIGRWANGAACDYYGKFGFASEALQFSGITGSVDGFYNLGIFRVVGPHRAYLKTYSEVDYAGNVNDYQFSGGGSPMDQINSQGYQTMYDAAINSFASEDLIAYHVGFEPGLTKGAEPVFGRGLAGLPDKPGKINGMVTHARMVDGSGLAWDEGQLHPAFAIPPLHVGWQGYLRNWIDESAANVFANARHSASKKVNLLSIYRSSVSAYEAGEGRDSDQTYVTYGVGVRSLNIFDINRLV